MSYWRRRAAGYLSLDEAAQRAFRFHHISTDEVYGDLEDLKIYSERTLPTRPAPPIQHRKQGLITSLEPGTNIRLAHIDHQLF